MYCDTKYAVAGWLSDCHVANTHQDYGNIYMQAEEAANTMKTVEQQRLLFLSSYFDENVCLITCDIMAGTQLEEVELKIFSLFNA